MMWYDSNMTDNKERKYSNDTRHYGSDDIALSMAEWSEDTRVFLPAAAALGIAAQWAAPTGTGNALASLSTGFPRAVLDIQTDIVVTLEEVTEDLRLKTMDARKSPKGWDFYDLAQLHALLDWFAHEAGDSAEDDE
jgi:hypothetical protein